MDAVLTVLDDEAKAAYDDCDNALFLEMKKYAIEFAKMMHDLAYRLPGRGAGRFLRRRASAGRRLCDLQGRQAAPRTGGAQHRRRQRPLRSDRGRVSRRYEAGRDHDRRQRADELDRDDPAAVQG